MKINRVIIILVTVLMLSVSLGIQERADSHIWPRYDGTLRIPFVSPTLILDPARDMTYEELSIFFAIYDGLFFIDDENQVRKNLATNYEVDSTYRRYVIEINQFARFHDGSRMTADDVVSSINRTRTRIGSKAESFDVIKDIRAIDKHTIEINLIRADPDFPRKLAHPFCHITKDGIKEESHDAIRVRYYEGTGAFRPGLVNSNGFRLERHDNYHRGRAYIQAINFELEPDEENSFLQFASGRFDIHRIPYSEYSEWMSADGVNRYVKPGNDTIILDFGNRAFRSALINAVRFESILNVVMNHSGSGYRGILTSDESGFFDKSNFTDTRLPDRRIVLGYYGDDFLLEPIARRIGIEWESRGVDVAVIKADELPCGICDVVLRIIKTMNQDDEFVWRSIRYDLGMSEPLPVEIPVFSILEKEEQAQILEGGHVYPIARPHMAFALSQHVRDFGLITGCAPDFWRINLR